MRKIIFTLLIFVISSALMSQTEVEGNQYGTWTTGNSPYLVIGQLVVPSGQILTIEPGVEINFQGYFKFTVEGNLQALGTSSDSIFFTTDNSDIGWGGIRFDGSNGINNLNYCRIEFGKTSGEYPDIHGGAVALLGADAVFDNCTFADNNANGENNGMGGAVYGINTGNPTKFTNCVFIRNYAYGEGGAVKFTSDLGTEFMKCSFQENNCLYGGGAISLYSVIGTQLNFCLFADNYTMYADGGAIQTLGTGNTLFLNNCTLTENQSVTGDGGAINLAFANASLVNCIIYNNSGMYSDDLNLAFGGDASINYCNSNIPDGATGSNNITVNPEFEDASNQNYRLQAGSPCIDTGTDIGYEFIGAAPDMGCYEYGLPTIVIEKVSLNMLVYPNPAINILNVNNSLEIDNVIIYDMSGKVVLKQTFNNKSAIDISSLKNGVYFTQLIFKNSKVQSQKFIKQ